jgi:hypothetical protein
MPWKELRATLFGISLLFDVQTTVKVTVALALWLIGLTVFSSLL